MEIREQRMGFDQNMPPLRQAVIAAVGFLFSLVFLSFAFLSHFLADAPSSPVDSSGLPAVVLPEEAPDYTTVIDVTVPVTASPPPIYYPVSGEATLSLSGKLDSDFAILMRTSDGVSVAELEADAKMYPASMTKIMTLILVCEYIESGEGSFEDEIEITWDMIKGVYDGDGANISLQIGEVVNVKDMIYATMLPSACDASAALAWYVGGTEKDFAELMNEKAHEIGMTGSSFKNSSGLYHKEHYSTARDVATMLNYALQDPFMREVMQTEEYTISGTSHHGRRTLRSTLSKMLSGYSGTAVLRGAEILGGKTGTLDEAGKCLASFAESEEGELYILVTAKASGSRTAVSDASYVYSNYA
jgi:D-alanyl-D-alanine carboxypeptidase (penicillin-binding protein 5/6)